MNMTSIKSKLKEKIRKNLKYNNIEKTSEYTRAGYD